MTLTRVRAQEREGGRSAPEVEPNSVPNAKSRQLAALDQSVDGSATEAQQLGHLRHPEQLALAKVWTAILW